MIVLSINFADFQDAGKSSEKLKGDFYGELNNELNGGIPPKNSFYPKAPKKLVGNFYKELNTQLEMKLPKKPAAQPVPEMPRPEDNMVPPPSPEGNVVPQQQVATAPSAAAVPPAQN
jgi:hypothetical protein